MGARPVLAVLGLVVLLLASVPTPAHAGTTVIHAGRPGEIHPDDLHPPGVVWAEVRWIGAIGWQERLFET